MKLDPSAYPCPNHPEVDLIDQVREVLEENGTHVAFARKPKPKKFEVPVTCPGVQDSPAHPLRCVGTWSE
jgi:hypothetical protein